MVSGYTGVSNARQAGVVRTLISTGGSYPSLALTLIASEETFEAAKHGKPAQLDALTLVGFAYANLKTAILVYRLKVAPMLTCRLNEIASFLPDEALEILHSKKAKFPTKTPDPASSVVAADALGVVNTRSLTDELAANR